MKKKTTLDAVVVDASAIMSIFEERPSAEAFKALPGLNKSRPWPLVTSAWHRPRALSTFIVSLD